MAKKKPIRGKKRKPIKKPMGAKKQKPKKKPFRGNKKRKQGKKRKKGKSAAPREEIDLLAPEYMRTAYYMCHDAADFLKVRGYPWAYVKPSKKGKKKGKPKKKGKK